MGPKTTKKTIRTRNQPGATKPAAVKKEPSTPTKSEKDDEGWGPIGAVAKKAAKGAAKGVAKELSK